MRALALLLLIAASAWPQAITVPGSPTSNPNQINVTTGYLYLNKMHYAGTWAGVANYTAQDVVTVAGLVYVSLRTGNLNNSPAASPLWWAPIQSVPSTAGLSNGSYCIVVAAGAITGFTPCSGGSGPGTLSWASLTNSQYLTLTNPQWLAMTN